ncbi:hypothetical protein MXAN_0851 [Myxococcus xanthus DK 1622]|uniref:Uncharacterized protein n=1 Tax=Myxococcus xanthus (strain DK1622) TaxID=246197 RepID=Q1DE10_MYXXD|nr:hypothetical protein MXAN_0851 [Myxococcus xanthus DK 1622]
MTRVLSPCSSTICFASVSEKPSRVAPTARGFFGKAASIRWGLPSSGRCFATSSASSLGTGLPAAFVMTTRSFFHSARYVFRLMGLALRWTLPCCSATSPTSSNAIFTLEMTFPFAASTVTVWRLDEVTDIATDIGLSMSEARRSSASRMSTALSNSSWYPTRAFICLNWMVGAFTSATGAAGAAAWAASGASESPRETTNGYTRCMCCPPGTASFHGPLARVPLKSCSPPGSPSSEPRRMEARPAPPGGRPSAARYSSPNERRPGSPGPLPHLQPLRGHVRPAHRAGRRTHHLHPGRRGGPLQPGPRLSQGPGAGGPAPGPGPAARPHAPHRQRLGARLLGRRIG